MYESYFYLQEPAISLTPDTRFVWLSETHEEGLAAGRPVVASRAGAALESVSSLGLPCDPGDEASLRMAAEGPAWAARWRWVETAKGLLQACFAAARGSSCRRLRSY